MLALVKLSRSKDDLNFFSFKDNSISFGNTFGYYREFMYPLDSIIIDIPFLIGINPIAIGCLIVIIYKDNGLVIEPFEYLTLGTFFFSYIYITIFVIDYRKGFYLRLNKSKLTKKQKN